MKNKIRNRQIMKGIKIHDAAVNVGDRIKDIGIKTKEMII